MVEKFWDGGSSLREGVEEGRGDVGISAVNGNLSVCVCVSVCPLALYI